MEEKSNETVWALRASAFEFAAFSLRYPNEQLADALVSGEWESAGREIAQAMGMRMPQNLAACATDEPVDSLLLKLRKEATRLFIGTGKPVLAPYEGMWRTAEAGGEGLMFVNKHSIEVAHFFAACGLGPSADANEPLDHIATEFELLEYLCTAAAENEPDAPTAAQESGFPGGSAKAAYRQFVEQHAITWMPSFLDELARKTQEPYFVQAAAFCKTLIQHAAEVQ